MTQRPGADLLAETREAVVLRLHGEPRAGEQQRGVVVYVPSRSSASTVAAQLRGVVDQLEKVRGQ